MYLTQKLEADSLDVVELFSEGYTVETFLNENNLFLEDEFSFSNLVVEYDLDWATLVSSSTQYDGETSTGSSQGTFAPTNVVTTPEKKGFTQELRLSSQLDGAYQFVTGFYYEDYEHESLQTATWNGSLESFESDDFSFLGTDPLWAIGAREKSLEQKAVFGELTYTLDEQWAFTFGGRWYDYERVDDNDTRGSRFAQFLRTPSRLETNEDGTTFKFNASYTPNEDSLIYAQWAQGFRLGEGQGLPDRATCEENGNLIGTNAPFEATVDSDTTENFELGSKFTLLDNRLTLNSALYRINWEEIPIQVFEDSDSCLLFQSLKVNAGEARSQGIELETQFHATHNLQLSLTASYTDTEFLDDGIGEKGDRLPLSPRVNATVGFEYGFELSGYDSFVRADYAYVGGYHNDVAGNSPEMGDYGKLNMRAGVEIDQFSIDIYGNNLTNEDDLAGGQGTTIGWRVRPRVIGVEVGYQF